MLLPIRLALIAVVMVVVTSCGGFLTPPTGPNTPYPCGYYGVSCYPVDQTHTCCPENHTCIPDNLCEYQGNDHEFGSSGKPNVVQRTGEHS